MSRNLQLVEGLFRAAEEGRLHHAYLLCGPESPLKLECAQKVLAHFSRSLFGGGSDDTLARIQRGNHPDFVRIAPEEGLISVDAMRALPKALSYPPLEAEKRVVVIDGAHLMNIQAANAFLKVLEEPPGHTMFFLLCREPGELLPTIVSRCQVLRFSPLSSDELLERLGEAAAGAGQGLASWSDGSLSRAEYLLGTEGGLELKREACERLVELWEASPRIPAGVFQWVEALGQEEGERITLDSWELLLRDLAFTASGAARDALYFPELHGRLSALAVGNEGVLDEVSQKSAAINRFRVYRNQNGNLRLDMAALLTELQVFSVGKARGRE